MSPLLPFGGNARWIESVQPIERITNSAGQWVKEMPYALANQGTNDDEIHLKWSEACKGTVSYVARMDNPNDHTRSVADPKGFPKPAIQHAVLDGKADDTKIREVVLLSFGAFGQIGVP